MATLTKQQVIDLQTKLNEVLQQFGVDNNMVVGKTHASFTSSTIEFKFAASTHDANPNAVDPRFLKDLRSRGWHHGLNEAMIGTKFLSGDQEVTFLGMRATKIVGRIGDKDYLFNAEVTAPRILVKFNA